MVRGATADGGSGYANDYADVRLLKLLADKLNITILLVHHLRKQGDDNPFNMISGTTGLTGAADGSFVLVRDKENTSQYKLAVTGRDIEQKILTLEFDSDACLWDMMSCESGALVTEEKSPDIVFAVCNYIKQKGNFEGSASELLAAMGDPVQAYLGGANMNSANGVRPLMKQLGDVAARTGCAILLVGHMNKGGGKSTYRGLGSIDIFAAARSVLTVGRIPVDENMRAIVHNKSNLAPCGNPQAFGIDTDGSFTWLDDYDITIDELLSGKSKPESQFTKARRLIETELRNGAVPAADIMQTAEEQGISPKTLNRAKDALGVLSVKRGVQWYWELPIEVEYTEVSQDGQHSQDSQSDDTHDGHGTSMTNMTALTIFRESEVV